MTVSRKAIHPSAPIPVSSLDIVIASEIVTESHFVGHQSSGRTGAWAWNDTNAQKDFGYRAFQLSYQAAKSLTEEYYGKSIFKKYFAGCSTAGRMGLVEAQRYPEDFDGIVGSFS